MDNVPPSTSQVTSDEFPEDPRKRSVDLIKRDLCHKVVPMLVPRLMKLFTSVIIEHTQRELKSRRQSLCPTCMQTWDDNSINELETRNHISSNLSATRSQDLSDNKTRKCPEEYNQLLDDSKVSTSKKNLNKNPNFTANVLSRKSAKMLRIASMLFLITISATSLSLFILWLVMNTGENMATDKTLETYQASNGVTRVSVGTCDEYNTAVLKSRNDRLVINIELESPHDWPSGSKITMSTNVSKLSIQGPFHIKKLTSLLGKVSSLESLELVNRNNGICGESTETLKTFTKRDKVSISVQDFTLEYIKSSTCLEALSELYDTIEFSHLKSFKYGNGEINTENLDLVENLLHKYRNGLKRLEITNTVLESSLFDTKPYFRFYDVNTLTIWTNIVKNNTNSSSRISSICSIFPNIKVLSFGKGVMQYQELTDIFKCKQLKSLQVSIWLPYSKTDFSLSILPEYFPYLESVDLTLLFGINFPLIDDKCREDMVNINGRSSVSKLLLANLRMDSNCRLQF